MHLIGFAFQETGPVHALEDRFRCDWDRRALTVADGVTRAFYPSDASQESGRVGAVADAFCAVAVDAFAQAASDGLAEAASRIGALANGRIAELNRAYGVEPTEDNSLQEPYGAVGCCAALGEDARWHFGYIGDCGVCLFAGEGGQVRLSQDQLAGTRRVLDALPNCDADVTAQFIRRHLRNRAEARDSEGRPCGFGVLNGNPSGEAWWRSGYRAAAPGDILVLHSDGGQLLVERPEFDALLQRFRKNGRADEGSTECRRLWMEISRRDPNFHQDDVTLVAALVRQGQR